MFFPPRAGGRSQSFQDILNSLLVSVNILQHAWVSGNSGVLPPVPIQPMEGEIRRRDPIGCIQFFYDLKSSSSSNFGKPRRLLAQPCLVDIQSSGSSFRQLEVECFHMDVSWFHGAWM